MAVEETTGIDRIHAVGFKTAHPAALEKFNACYLCVDWRCLIEFHVWFLSRLSHGNVFPLHRTRHLIDSDQ